MSTVASYSVPALSGTGEDAESVFAALVERHRRELHVHCYRMLGSFTEAEDLVQETFLRAWQHRDTVTSSAGPRAWLYGIATNICLDALRRRSRRASSQGSVADVPWLQPYSDHLLNEIAPSDTEPETVVIGRETISLAFLMTIQLLPPRQRAVLILRDVLDWSAAEAAAMLETTVAAANSALQRARTTLQEQLPMPRPERSATTPSTQERALLERYVDAMQ
ncbi:RNA polymerase subunit sigma-70 [Nonomuraea sp. NBC_00507]|uniref:RNA polymerase subunit sigma-70 n=1 Tax=Nonomuraea sp. NBC_00507 TaxID=2976002 RepID=UPI002E19A701